MKKIVLFGLVLFLGFSSQAFAAAGYANDGLKFTLGLVLVLLLFAGLLKGIDYLQKNGERLIHKFNTYLKKKYIKLLNLLNKVNSEYFDMSYF
ncbi:hypothetical protein D4S03_01255 [bacterium]|nr:MAG: hypothetical protein D4S03_01255 [bacterium]